MLKLTLNTRTSKHRHRAIGAALTILLVMGAGQATANDNASLAACAQIAKPLDRLACYDALADTTADTNHGARATAAPQPRPVAQLEPPPSKDAMDNFGLERKAAESEKKELVARYDGEFSGWSGRTLFKLDNGQVWRQVQSGRFVYRRDNPAITIRKGAFGSYRLSVEGTKRSVRVKRVK